MSNTKIDWKNSLLINGARFLLTTLFFWVLGPYTINDFTYNLIYLLLLWLSIWMFPVLFMVVALRRILKLSWDFPINIVAGLIIFPADLILFLLSKIWKTPLLDGYPIVNFTLFTIIKTPDDYLDV